MMQNGKAKPNDGVAKGRRLRQHVWRRVAAATQAQAAAEELRPLRGRGVAGGDLAEQTVMVFGLGAVGGRCFNNLARLGVGCLYGVDPDSYGARSWETQPCLPTDAGREKAEVQGALAHAVRPSTSVTTITGLAQDLPLWMLRQADLFVLAGDNLEVAVWAGVQAAALGKRLVHGAVHGESWLSVVRGYDLRDPQNTCPACGLGLAEWSMLKSRFGCDPSLPRSPGLEPTRTLPNLCGTTAELLTSEALKCLLGLDAQTLNGEELSYCGLPHRAMRSELSRNPRCRCPHEQCRLRDIAKSPADVTFATVLSAMNARVDDVQVHGELPWNQYASCEECDRHVPMRCFGRTGDPVDRCSCGNPLVAAPLGAQRVVPREDLRSCLDIPLALLGVSPGQAISVSMDGESTHLFIGRPSDPELNEPEDFPGASMVPCFSVGAITHE